MIEARKLAEIPTVLVGVAIVMKHHGQSKLWKKDLLDLDVHSTVLS